MSKGRIPKDRIYREVERSLYLKEILRRLDTEYITILKMIKKRNITHKRGIGFWSLTRIIFPVIETVAYIIGKEKEEFLEQDLKVPFGHLVWELYRHALMHGDELRYAVYKGKSIAWAIHLDVDGIGHFMAKQTQSHPTTIHIDISRLYYALQEYLNNEIKKKDKSKISIQVGVHFPVGKNKLLDELDELFEKY